MWTLADLIARLEGATALNIYLLHRLGGSVTLRQAELERVLHDFPHLIFSGKDDEVYVRIGSCNHGPTHGEVPA